MSTVKLKTYDEEWLGETDESDHEPYGVLNRLESLVKPELAKLDTVNNEYLITITIEKLPH